jgi:hypothetical protein
MPCLKRSAKWEHVGVKSQCHCPFSALDIEAWGEVTTHSSVHSKQVTELLPLCFLSPFKTAVKGAKE